MSASASQSVNTNNPAPTVIYPAQGVMTLISRAWNLTRCNLKASILMMLPPILLVTVVHMLLSIISSRTVLTSTTFQALSYQILIAGVSVLLLIPYFYLWIFSSCALSRYYFSAIVEEKPLSVKDCWRYVAQNWLLFGSLATGLGLANAVLIFINLAILGLGVFVSGALMIALSTAIPHIGNALIPSLMLLLFLLVWGFIILTLAVCMTTFQAYFFLFPLLAVSTSPTGREPWWPLVRKSFKLLVGNFPRLLLFSVAIFFLVFTLMAVVMGPASIWVMVEMARQGVSHHDRLPFHVQAIVNLWSSLANLVIGPFQISAVTLLWYDCLVRKEGLDLKLWFNQLVRRHGHQPEEYHTEAEPQSI